MEPPRFKMLSPNIRDYIRSSHMSSRGVPSEPIVSESACCGRTHEYSGRPALGQTPNRLVFRSPGSGFAYLVGARYCREGAGPPSRPYSHNFFAFLHNDIAVCAVVNPDAAEESERGQSLGKRLVPLHHCRCWRASPRPIGNDVGNQQVFGVERSHSESAYPRNQRGFGFLYVEGALDAVANRISGDRTCRCCVSLYWRHSASIFWLNEIPHRELADLWWLLRILLLQCILQRADAEVSRNRNSDFQLRHRVSFQYSPPHLGRAVPSAKPVGVRREEYCRLPLSRVLHVWRLDASLFQGAAAPGRNYRFHVSLSCSRLRGRPGGLSARRASKHGGPCWCSDCPYLNDSGGAL